jgi:hypothetical protein
MGSHAVQPKQVKGALVMAISGLRLGDPVLLFIAKLANNDKRVISCIV